MAAYNSEKTIRQAVTSLLAGTIPCQLYVIDDCSRIPVADVLAPQPARVEVIRLAQNAGPAGARNAGLKHILAKNYNYIAVMDADDISYPDRLAKQVAFLDRNPKVGAVGTWARFFDEATGATVFNQRTPVQSDAIRKAMFFNSGIVHPSVMIRAEALRRVGFYSGDYPAAEDYELLRRIATQFELANLPEILLDYRLSSRGMSIGKRRRQLFDRLRIQLKYFEMLEWRAWAGVVQTSLLFLIPRKVVVAWKSERIWRPRHAC
jgi:glycosyltransferase involved in cell wall biosynthesis